MPVNGASLAYAVAGSLIAYSGIKGATLSDTVKAVLSGNLNVTDTQGLGGTITGSTAGTVPAGNTGASNATAADNQALAKQLAAQLGHADWTTGQEWADWVSLWNQESGWQDAANPTSDARGIAQKITGYDASYPKGDMTAQITWGIEYIAGRYGSPSMAWQHEITNNWY